MSLIVRPRRDHDLAACARVHQRAWRHAYSHIFTAAELDGIVGGSPAADHDLSRQGAGTLSVLVAVDSNEEVVGFAGFHVSGGAPTRTAEVGEGRLVTLYVDPAYQGAGAGTTLWEAVCERLRARGCAVLQVWTLRRARAVGFYLARGAREVATGTFTAGGHVEPAVCLRFEL